MAEARDRSEWNRTASIVAMVANTIPRKNGKWISADDVNPYTAGKRRRGIPITKENITMLKKLVPKKG